SFASLTGLRYIGLAGNRIRDLPQVLMDLPNLAEVNLHYNILCTLSTQEEAWLDNYHVAHDPWRVTQKCPGKSVEQIASFAFNPTLRDSSSWRRFMATGNPTACATMAYAHQTHCSHLSMKDNTEESSNGADGTGTARPTSASPKGLPSPAANTSSP
ncbi:unnamed protein product, partial [marine sediment metagenome]